MTVVPSSQEKGKRKGLDGRKGRRVSSGRRRSLKLKRDGMGEGRTLPSSCELDSDLLIDVFRQIEDLLPFRLVSSSGLTSSSTTSRSSSSASSSSTAGLVASSLGKRGKLR